MAETSNRYRIFAVYLGLALVVFVVFAQVRHHDFVNYDDPQYVTENPYVKAGLTREGLVWASTTARIGGAHPVTWLSHMLDCQLFDTNPAGHHLTNILLHIANTLLLLAILRYLTGKLWQSAFVAALFALHPLHVESVAWIADRKDLLCMFFWLLTIAAYARYTRKPDLVRYLLALLTFTLALLSKPMAVTIPVVLLLLDYWPLGRLQRVKPSQERPGPTFVRLLIEKIPFFVLSLLWSVITYLAQQAAGAVTVRQKWSYVGFSVANAFISYLTYIQKTFWPRGLAVFYPHPLDTVSIPHAIVAAVIVLAVTVAAIRFARSRRYLLTGWLWYIITLLPVIGLIQFGTHARADRFTYIPLTGLFIIIAWGIPELSPAFKHKRIFLTTAAVVVLSALSVRSYSQLGYWRNSITLFEHSLEVTGDNALAHYNLGVAFKDAGQVTQAIRHLRKSHELDPTNPRPMQVLAWLLATHPENKYHDPAQAAHLAEQLCRLTNYNIPAFLDTLAAAYAAQGRFAQAVELAEKALQLAQMVEPNRFQQLQHQRELEQLKHRLELYKAGKPYIEPADMSAQDAQSL